MRRCPWTTWHCNGFARPDLFEKISELGLGEEVYPVGARTMISVGVARTVAGSLETTDYAALVDWFDTEILCHLCHGQSDKEHGDTQTRLAVERILAREPDATPEMVAEDLGIDEQAAVELIRAVRFVQRYKAENE
jgi:hypothetical protein